MNDQIGIDDVKLWIGELVIENRLLQKRLNQLASELQQIRIQLKENGDVGEDIPKKEEEMNKR